MDSPKDRRPSPTATLSKMLRICARAALMAAPDTPLTAREFAWVMSLRRSRAAALKPPALWPTRRAHYAPFRVWLALLAQAQAPAAGTDTDADVDDPQPSISQLRRPRPGAGR